LAWTYYWVVWWFWSKSVAGRLAFGLAVGFAASWVKDGGVTTSGPLDRCEPHGHLTQRLIRALPLTVGSADASLPHRPSETCAGGPALCVGSGGGVMSAWS